MIHSYEDMQVKFLSVQCVIIICWMHLIANGQSQHVEFGDSRHVVMNKRISHEQTYRSSGEVRLENNPPKVIDQSRTETKSFKVLQSQNGKIELLEIQYRGYEHIDHPRFNTELSTPHPLVGKSYILKITDSTCALLSNDSIFHASSEIAFFEKDSCCSPLFDRMSEWFQLKSFALHDTVEFPKTIAERILKDLFIGHRIDEFGIVCTGATMIDDKECAVLHLIPRSVEGVSCHNAPISICEIEIGIENCFPINIKAGGKGEPKADDDIKHVRISGSGHFESSITIKVEDD